MAMTEREDGKTIFGSTSSGGSAIQGVGLNAPSGGFAYLSMIDTAGVEWWLWMDTSGNLRRSNTKPTVATQGSAGSVVGP